MGQLVLWHFNGLLTFTEGKLSPFITMVYAHLQGRVFKNDSAVPNFDRNSKYILYNVCSLYLCSEPVIYY